MVTQFYPRRKVRKESKRRDSFSTGPFVTVPGFCFRKASIHGLVRFSLTETGQLNYSKPCMARKLRIKYPNAVYHLMSRGDQLEDILLDDVDRQDFIKTLAEACRTTGWQVHAYCLMRNHYHLMLETPNANRMRWFTPREQRRKLDNAEAFGGVRRGWCLGNEECRQEPMRS
jgi:REP element-mobilizing transposase RayT